MTSRALDEAAALAVLQEELPTPSRRVRVGIGDDAAVLAGGRGAQVWTVDACLEGVHFRRAWLSPADIAHKAFHSAVSDVAAMGAKPLAILSQLTIPHSTSRAELKAFASSQATCSRELRCSVVGGNLSFGESWGCVTTAVGELPRGASPLRRDGAKVGDELWLSGEVGLARAGYLLLERGLVPDVRSYLQGSRQESRACLQAFARPSARVGAGRKLLARARAAMDVSDGLRSDLPRLAAASGVRVVVDADKLEAACSPSVRVMARVLGEEVLDLLMSGGEDYALAATGPKLHRPRGVAVIGRVEAGQGVHVSRR